MSVKQVWDPRTRQWYPKDEDAWSARLTFTEVSGAHALSVDVSVGIDERELCADMMRDSSIDGWNILRVTR
jgi:hypothetical protein